VSGLKVYSLIVYFILAGYTVIAYSRYSDFVVTYLVIARDSRRLYIGLLYLLLKPKFETLV